MSTLSEENRVLKEMLQQKTLYTAKTGMFEVRRALSDGFTQRYQIDGGSNDGLDGRYAGRNRSRPGRSAYSRGSELQSGSVDSG